MNKTRLAVIGTGHLGKIHARLAKSHEHASLVAVVDPIVESRQAVASQLEIAAYASHTDLYGQVDAAILASPTKYHHAVALDLLRRGIHVLVEKPITLTSHDADELIAAADARSLQLQVGHVERFNPALEAAAPHVGDAKYIDAVRNGTYTCRSTDVGVVLDLMIHDIDVILSLVREPVVSIDALGAAVFGPHEDWAQARLVFEGGCVANISASRVSLAPQRSMMVHWSEGYAQIDYGAKTAKLVNPSEEILRGEIDVNKLSLDEKNQIKDRLFEEHLRLSQLPVVDNNAILDEQKNFLSAIAGRERVRVSGRDGRDALAVAEQILQSIAAHCWDRGDQSRRADDNSHLLRGPHFSRSAPLVRRNQRMAG